MGNPLIGAVCAANQNRHYLVSQKQNLYLQNVVFSVVELLVIAVVARLAVAIVSITILLKQRKRLKQ